MQMKGKSPSMALNNIYVYMKKYYVYQHSYSNGKVFYVGKGTDRRAWQKRKGEAWQKPYIVEIIFDDLTEQEAFDAESILIDLYGVQNLANKKREHLSDKTKSLEEYKVIQYAKDLVWIKENIDKVDFKNPFIKEQMEIWKWSLDFRDSIQKYIPLLNS